RIDWITRMDAAPKPVEEKRIKIEVGDSFLGSKVIDAVNISKSLGGKLLFEHFTYRATAGDRIGIIGPNGCGKSTLLRILAGEIESDSGSVKIGSSVRIGFFRQEDTHFDPGKSVIGTLREVAEFIDTGVGRERYLSASDMLRKFHFPNRKQSALVGTLSGGERRRLALLLVLMNDPNVLFLDEPTNDFDLQTMGALEEYLQHFRGFLVTVSHDRMFLDRTVEYIYAFDGEGHIKQYPGNYTAYLERKEREAISAASDEKNNGKRGSKGNEGNEVGGRGPETHRRQGNEGKRGIRNPKKLTWKEEREFEQLERDIAALEEEKAALNERMHTDDATDYAALADIGHRIQDLDDSITALSDRWLHLAEKMDQ
ncbi:MAG: ABC-F family ATP-binding cassette domain-containing protein, partial [Bacteroidetes bacterium]|nr:ABC-F family ATP-binding cassette domain-containing protein [Bacteroidota bacterium]